MYAMYMSSLGNRPDLFPQSGYISKYYENPPADYEIPPAYLEDEQFARLIEEAEKYVGFPYVWGGSSPETSFDCSGFVSYVLTNSGLYNTGRLGAQGLYNISTRVSNPQPGDLVFFTGTYDTPGVSHVGILSSEKPGDKVKEITARLEQGIQAIFDSDRYKEFLTAMSKFHDYSLNNTILIAMQGGNLVKGYSQWQKEFDRHVKSGEKGIKIFAPAPYKVKKLVDKIDPDTRKPILDSEGKTVKEEKEVTVPAFKVVTVFDISQTEGKEFPDLSVKPLLADVEQYEDFFAALEKASPVPIAFEQITNGANGYFSLTDKRIAIKEGVSELQAVKTAIHEIAHAKLHDVDLNAPLEEQNRIDRRSREVQAESVAYTVCQHFGLDTSDYSFGYVAGWSSGKEMTELKASLETIQETAKELITEIEGHFTELQQQRQLSRQRLWFKIIIFY